MHKEEALYSVRMRASLASGRHLSGAERLVKADDVEAAVLELTRRARRDGADPDYLNVTVDRVPAENIEHIPCLPVTTVAAPDPASARQMAEHLLRRASVSPAAIAAAFDG